MRLIQFYDSLGERCVAAIFGNDAPRVVPAHSTRELVLAAHQAGAGLEAHVRELGLGEKVDYPAIIAEKRLLVPLDHPDPAHCVLHQFDIQARSHIPVPAR